ncbi:Mitochondrial import inner membrane translocase subunit tim54 [Erysiphe neolycopersici]|uniref:Mitochondrial import inner membrane translocase subunit TIM54 n=1 Tax=Erysiphe neolycopersici TaxID=212602 RepID=A0A420HJ50_9PEZI|nr:Mitochondrial import inner membrane translocase subunit tim54 [Erysiphe neolycopersici]
MASHNHRGTGDTITTVRQDALAGGEQNSKNTLISSSGPKRKPNPIWKYMGFGENFHPRLPSRNWMIFLSMVGSFSAAVIYDKREKKRNQLKWCKLVEHIAKQPLDSRTMPRKLSIFLQAPPQNGLRSAQDHFKEFVKPILVSSGLDWEFIQGRKEGEIREKVSDRIKNSRLSIEERAEKDCIAQFRLRNNVKDCRDPGGDIIIGRHTWKEYIQGIHEGWLAAPRKPSDLPSKSQNGDDQKGPSINSSEILHDNEPSSDSKPTENLEKLASPLPCIEIKNYFTLPLPIEIPCQLEPSVPISFPHLLGFFNTPKRLYRFLNRRKLADSIGRETAAAILSSYRPYKDFPDQMQPEFSTGTDSHYLGSNAPPLFEQQIALQDEEKDWHKSVWVEQGGESKRPWSSPLVLDPRIATRMRKFELTPEEEEKANSIKVLEEEVEGWVKGSIRNLWRAGVTALSP